MTGHTHDESRHEPQSDPQKPPDVRDADQVIRTYYESDTQAPFREDGTEPVSSTRETAKDVGRLQELSGGDVDAAVDQADVGTETVGGSNPTPDQDIVEDLGKAVGVTYQDNEPLKFGDKVTARDEDRWELNPASSEDYQTRTSQGQPAEAEQSPKPSKTRGRKPKTRRAST